MRALALLAAACLLTFAAPLASAEPSDGPFSPTCPYLSPLVQVCVGGVLQCFVSVQFAGGEKHCLV